MRWTKALHPSLEVDPRALIQEAVHCVRMADTIHGRMRH